MTATVKVLRRDPAQGDVLDHINLAKIMYEHGTPAETEHHLRRALELLTQPEPPEAA